MLASIVRRDTRDVTNGRRATPLSGLVGQYHHSYGSGTFEATIDPDRPDSEPVSSTPSEQPGLTMTVNHFERADPDE